MVGSRELGSGSYVAYQWRKLLDHFDTILQQLNQDEKFIRLGTPQYRRDDILKDALTTRGEYFDKRAAGDDQGAGEEEDNLCQLGAAVEDTCAPPVIDAEIVSLGDLVADGARMGLANSCRSDTDGEPPVRRENAREILRGMREMQQRAAQEETQRRGSEALEQREEEENMDEDLAMALDAVHLPVENDEQEQGQGMIRGGEARKEEEANQRKEQKRKRLEDEGREARKKEARERDERERKRLEDERKDAREKEAAMEREDQERKRVEEEKREAREKEAAREREEQERKRVEDEKREARENEEAREREEQERKRLEDEKREARENEEARRGVNGSGRDSRTRSGRRAKKKRRGRGVNVGRRDSRTRNVRREKRRNSAEQGARFNDCMGEIRQFGEQMQGWDNHYLQDYDNLTNEYNVLRNSVVREREEVRQMRTSLSTAAAETRAAAADADQAAAVGALEEKFVGFLDTVGEKLKDMVEQAVERASCGAAKELQKEKEKASEERRAAEARRRAGVQTGQSTGAEKWRAEAERKKEEEKRRKEEARLEGESKKEEEKRRKEEEERIEAERKKEEGKRRKEEEARIEAERKKEEEKRQKEEEARLEEERKKEEKKRQKEGEARLEEERKKEDEKRQKEEEVRIEEERNKEEEKRQKEGEARLEEDRKKEEDARKRADGEAAKVAEETRKKAAEERPKAAERRAGPRNVSGADKKSDAEARGSKIQVVVEEKEIGVHKCDTHEQQNFQVKVQLKNSAAKEKALGLSVGSIAAGGV
ncbi:unnamed protein product [Closterium sp. Naga37s-1]|nr:unnamed protein product [Closterium sp. Naga37s-1]